MSQDINLIVTCSQIDCPYNHEKECSKEVLYINDSECIVQAESESEGKPSFWWKCERCGKLIPYMADFCHECAYELLGEPPKPFEPQESEEKE